MAVRKQRMQTLLNCLRDGLMQRFPLYLYFKTELLTCFFGIKKKKLQSLRKKGINHFQIAYINLMDLFQQQYPFPPPNRPRTCFFWYYFKRRTNTYFFYINKNTLQMSGIYFKLPACLAAVPTFQQTFKMLLNRKKYVSFCKH